MIKKIKSLHEFRSNGGKASWKKISKKERSRRMRELANKRWAKKRKEVKRIDNLMKTKANKVIHRLGKGT